MIKTNTDIHQKQLRRLLKDYGYDISRVTSYNYDSINHRIIVSLIPEVREIKIDLRINK